MFLMPGSRVGRKHADTRLIRNILRKQADYFFSPFGSDMVGDGSLTNPWRQLQHGFDFVFQNLDCGGRLVFFHMLAGGYGGLWIHSPLLNCRAFALVGDNLNPASVIINNYSGSNQGSLISLEAPMNVWISGFRMEPPNFAQCLEADPFISGLGCGTIFIGIPSEIGAPTFLPASIQWGGAPGPVLINVGNIFDWGTGNLSLIDATNWANVGTWFLSESPTNSLISDFPIVGSPTIGGFFGSWYVVRGAGSTLNVQNVYGTNYVGIGTGRKFAVSGGGYLGIPDRNNAPGDKPGVATSGGFTLSNDGLFDGQSRVLATQFDKTSDAALADIPDLELYLHANGNYSFEAVLFTTSNAAGGVKAAIAAAAGGGLTVTAVIYDVDITEGTVYTTNGRATALGTAIGVTAVTTAKIVIHGRVKSNTDGYLSVQFAQNASSGSTSSVLAGSYFRMTEMA